jgi:hypothetical protein
LTDADIRKAVVAKVYPDVSLDEKPELTVAGMFEVISASHKDGDGVATLKDQLEAAARKKATDGCDPEAARQKMMETAKNQWKTKTN